MYSSVQVYCTAFFELIDTLWNVNLLLRHNSLPPARELIDTLWNVNKKPTFPHHRRTGINRYIMECKFIYDSISLWIFCELIDTLWNVNEEPEQKPKKKSF